MAATIVYKLVPERKT